MTPERAAAVAATQREIADRFEHLGITDPHDRAESLVRWLQRKGWRVHPELADGAPPIPRPADPAVAQARIAEARAALEAKRGNRPELETQP